MNVRVGEGTSSKVLEWVWQPDRVLIFGRGTQNPPQPAMAASPCVEAMLQRSCCGGDFEAFMQSEIKLCAVVSRLGVSIDQKYFDVYFFSVSL